jgi:hydrogenase nickel incorporation protein HypB
VKIQVGKNVLSANDQQALANRRRLDELKLTGVNVLASPGAGKTSLISALLTMLPTAYRSGVIEGDVAGRIDADKIAALGFPVTQINTAGGCHLDAGMIARAMDDLKLAGPGFLFIENIGNLICPAEFQLGEALRMVVASVPEGDDKPIKYPLVFSTAQAVILNKTDLLGMVDFQMHNFVAAVRAVNPNAPIFTVSCRKREGLSAVVDWLLQHAGPAKG